jgi:hypothetical protein
MHDAPRLVSSSPELGVRARTRQRRETSSREGHQHDGGKKAAREGAEISAPQQLLVNLQCSRGGGEAVPGWRDARITGSSP